MSSLLESETDNGSDLEVLVAEQLVPGSVSERFGAEGIRVGKGWKLVGGWG